MPLVSPIWVLVAAVLIVGGVVAAYGIVRLRYKKRLRAVMEAHQYKPAPPPTVPADVLPHVGASGVRVSDAWADESRTIARVDYVIGGVGQRRNVTRVLAVDAGGRGEAIEPVPDMVVL